MQDTPSLKDRAEAGPESGADGRVAGRAEPDAESKAGSNIVQSMHKSIISALAEKQFLVSKELYLGICALTNEEGLAQLLARIRESKPARLTDILNEALGKQSLGDAERGPDSATLDSGMAVTVAGAANRASARAIFSYTDYFKKREVEDFVAYFNHRYNALEKMLRKRQELTGVLSINRILTKTERDSASLIGMVKDKQESKRGAIILTLEDPTGEIKAIVTSRHEEAYRLAKDVVYDEVVGVRGVIAERAFFVQSMHIPEVPLHHEFKKSQDEAYAIVISDLHVGSNKFLQEKFEKFLRWLSGDAGSEEQRQTSAKVRYLFVVGDLVDGVGIYPNQRDDLAITDIREQYAACAKLLGQVPAHIKMIICGGNHDAMRLAEPQPVFYEEFSGPILRLHNTLYVTNPSLVRIHESEGFSGFNVLMYHGYSFDHYIANVNSIRTGGGYDRADLVMKFLLQRRHLAPTHASTLYIPDTRADYHVLETVPDFFFTGHLHKAAVANYRNITLVCGSCWQDITAFQRRVGHHPEPARVPMINLRTREVKILRF